MRPLFVLLTLFAILPGCASRDPLVARQKSYERLATFIEPGMTRRQLYALLPPRRPATMGNTSMMMSTKDYSTSPGVRETYPLDRDFAVNVSFLAVQREPIKRRPGPISANAIDALLNPNQLPHPKAKRRKSSTGVVPISPQLDARAIDRLLFGLAPKPIPSKQNPDDEICDRPKIVRDFSSILRWPVTNQKSRGHSGR